MFTMPQNDKDIFTIEEIEKLVKEGHKEIVLTGIHTGHYGADLEKEDFADLIKEENIEALAIGIDNLKRHVENIRDRYGLTPIVAINRYKNDTEKELKFLEDELNKIGVNLSLADVWAKGGEGAIDLAEKVVKLAEGESKINFVYKDEESIKISSEPEPGIPKRPLAIIKSASL